MSLHPRITKVVVTGPFQVALDFTDGSRGLADLAPLIRGRGGVFELLQDAAYFGTVAVDPDAGTLVWPNGVDLDPDMLYELAHGSPVGGPRGRGGV